MPLTDDAKEVLERRTAKSPNGYIFPIRRPKTKNREVKRITSFKKGHERVIKNNFADDPFTIYTLQLQEEREAEDWKPKEDEWGVPILEVEGSSPQNPPHEAEIGNLMF